MATMADSSTTRVRRDRRGIRVLLAAPSLAIYGGQAIMAARLIEQFKAEPILDVAFQPHNPRLPLPVGWLQRIKYVRTVVTTLAYVVALLCRAWRYDVIHVFSASYYSYLLSAVPALAVGRLFGKKTILNYRSGEAEDHLEHWRSAAATMRWASRIIVPSGYLVQVFARHGLAAHAIFNTVAVDRFRFRQRQPLRPNFLSARLLEPIYNVGCAIRAFAIIQRQYPDARLTVAGEGSERRMLEDLVGSLDLKNVSFIGRVDHERMPQLLDEADIYLNANELDNMPSSLIECMASGVAVVTTDAGGIPFIVTHEATGLMVARNDPEAMARAAMRLLEEPGLASAIASRARIECQKYQWPVVREDWVSLYRELTHREARGLVIDGVAVVPRDLP